jgi:hypothetical protein
MKSLKFNEALNLLFFTLIFTNEKKKKNDVVNLCLCRGF